MVDFRSPTSVLYEVSLTFGLAGLPAVAASTQPG